MALLNSIIVKLDDFVWGIPLIVLILLVGINLTIRLGLLQIRHLGKAFKFMIKDGDASDEGDVTSFGALCVALSATIGTGNIVGVATAVCAGGPGALFWMVVAAFFGMATKYAEGLLAVKYRTVDKEGAIIGGPFYYIENGMGKNWKWLARLFAIFALMAGAFGIGTFTQINGITSAVKNFFDPNLTHTVTIFTNEYSLAAMIAGAIVTFFAALVILGGLQRIAKVSEIIVPFMALTYIVICLMLLLYNIKQIPEAIGIIIEGAFNPSAVTGGAIGSGLIVMQKGIARGIFSNEAGLGSAPIAAAAAKTKEPVKQGLVSMTGTFIDTIVICSMTGLSIVVTGAWKIAGLKGVEVTDYAFANGLPFNTGISSFILMICLVFFAFTTILGWNYYSEKCLQYLCDSNRKIVMGYRVIYLIAVFMGPYMTVEAVWNIADICNGLMAIPNLIALLALSGVVIYETKQYFNKSKEIS